VVNKRWLVTIVIVVAAVILAVILDTVLANHRPAITGLTADPERVTPRGICQIVCTASDADGDELSYNWSANGGEISGEGATVTWRAPRSSGSYNVTVNVTDGQGGEATNYVTIEVRTNKGPTITGLIADTEWTLPSGNIQVTCTASDSDGDELSYEWSASGGVISGTGPEVIWTAPEDTGKYDITVVVTDDHGSSDTRKLCSTVVIGEPPSIEALLVTAEHCYMRTYSWGYKVGKEQDYQIECTVTDVGSELSYNWSCEYGAISGEGSVITWSAPDEYVRTMNVTVTVSDIAGNMVCKSIVLEVVSCSSCTFGC
jgi:hypothetical protein